MARFCDNDRMQIVEVIPISRGIGASRLSYFSVAHVEPGSLVFAPLRRKKVPALVVSVREAGSAKSEIKSLSFEMKRLGPVIAASFFTEEFMQAVSSLADWYATTEGSVLAALAPRQILERAETLVLPDGESEEGTAPQGHARTHEQLPTRASPQSESPILLMQAETSERESGYKSLIREEFAAKRSVLCITPTVEEAKRLKASLEKGIEQYSFLLTSSMKPALLAESWHQAVSEKHPVLVVATGGFLCLPRGDFGTIIVEREGARSYRMPSRPYIDIRTAAELFARAAGARLILGDILLRIETVARQENGSAEALRSFSFRPPAGGPVSVVDMRIPKDAPEQPFRVISPELEEAIRAARTANGKTFLWCARRGYAPTTLCRDCGESVSCTNCSAPVVLHEKDSGQDELGNPIKKRFFVCHRCGARRSAHETCVRCGSWRLASYGIGITQAAESVQALFPDAPLFIFDSDSIKTEAQGDKLMAAFAASSGGILLGTETALPRLPNIELAAAISPDPLLSLPDFRIHERLLGILLHLKSKARAQTIIQTRRPDESIFRHALHGTLAEFYRETLAERRLFGYPPFKALVKISVTGTEARAKEEAAKVEHLFAGEEIYTFPAFVPRVAGKFTMHSLLKANPNHWPEKRLLEKLRSLPPFCEIRCDPEHLL